MTEVHQVYKCNTCGIIVDVLHRGYGMLICCGDPMELLVERTQDELHTEKHVPVVTPIEDGIKVTVGSTAHPMGEDHYIEWIEATENDRVHRTFLKPGQPPEAVFQKVSEKAKVRAYCNIHELWRTK